MVLHVVLAILILLIILCVYVFKCSCFCLSCDQSHDRNQEVDQYKASSMSNNQGGHGMENTYTFTQMLQKIQKQVMWVLHS